MHTVFSVDELLFHIFTLIGDTSDKDTKRDLAILARTCKAFNGVALRILWQDLNEAIPLFSLLPVVTKVYSILVSLVTSF
jgi:3-methyladenine DNA glycosylase/8-oxoguanine DNA glycosylase